MKFYKKIFFIVIACILLFVSLYIGIQIYAKYLSSATGDTSIAISRWNIKVNSQTIKTNTDISTSIVPVFPGNDNIAANIIAPTAEGYFDLSFDFTDVDVSFTYNIAISPSVSSAVSDLIATGYSVDGGETTTFANYNDPISDTILLSSNVTSRTIRIFIKWNDNAETASMNNLQDTESAISENNNAIFNVAISFTQLAN